MFQLKFANKSEWQKQHSEPVRWTSELSRSNVERTLYLFWEEHCIECGIPECYTSCALYVPRADKACARFTYGIYPNKSFGGEFDFGADILFRRWGKIEGVINKHSVPTRSKSHPFQSWFWSLPGRVKTLATLFKGFVLDTSLRFDDFVVECYSPSRESFNLLVEYSARGETRFRHCLTIHPGHNFHTIPVSQFNLLREGWLRLTPEDTTVERRIIFTWLNFVRYHTKRKSAEKVKCVAWDLDNTVWNGTLAEVDDPNRLQLRSGILEAIEEFDRRGIVQSIVSKNTYAEAWPQVERLGISEYFVYPLINWNPKSENLNALAKKLNIGIDTFAFIDDSAFERSEVQSALPSVKVYSEAQVPWILSRSEFDLPVTSASKTRRLSYLTEMQRDKEQTSFSGGYEDFLVSCQIKLHVSQTKLSEDVLRSWELVQRSNQLNLSTRRYSLEEFKTLLATPGVLGLSLSCKDRFGDWGIVGFASLNLNSASPVLTDFVLSCRVAQKTVEHAFIKWLADYLRTTGKEELRAEMVITEKNKPLRDVFDSLPFRILNQNGERVTMSLDLGETMAKRQIISVASDVSNDDAQKRRANA